ncbi:MAG: SDR family NAD(P)-dependent oxidoreductase [Planctomycetia bacterium]|nr:SDR family NAD(P)-dependent oxidoreductase [Planctomycetia bacterium]
MRRVALVTGGNRGIGLAACRGLAKAGLDVVLGSREAEAGEEAARSLRDTGVHVRVLGIDVAKPLAIEHALHFLKAEKIHVDVLVNNAGVYSQEPALGDSDAAFREAWDVHVMGPLALCRALIPGMKKAKYGRVVNVSSGYGAFSEAMQGPPAYAVTKAALNALTVKIAAEAGTHVKVNSMCPGWVQTRMGGTGAPLTPEQGADTIVWLATLPEDGPTGGFYRERQVTAW